MHPLVSTLAKEMPTVQFCSGASFCWSPGTQTISYPDRALNNDTDLWAILHETAHSCLGHQAYETDFELLMMETAAWQYAKELGGKKDIIIDDDHIQDCLDTYRDWLHSRSTCPTCGIVGLQHSSREYACHNCNSTWQVTSARFCRAYRLKNHGIQKTPLGTKSQTVFQ